MHTRERIEKKKKKKLDVLRKWHLVILIVGGQLNHYNTIFMSSI